MSLKESRVVPMKSTVAPAEGERTKRVAASESRLWGVSSTWMVSVVFVIGSEGISGVYVDGSLVDMVMRGKV